MEENFSRRFAMKVEDIMTRKIETIESGAPVYDAVEKMVDKRLRSLLVKPIDEKDVYGVITVRDIIFKLIGKNLNLHKVMVNEIASKPVVCVNRNLSVEHAINLMQNFNIARVFVCDGEEVVGVVSLMDVMAAALIQKAKGGQSA
jgi:CBS domain-containing protein